MPSSLLVLEPTTLFFHTLCFSRQCHVASVKNWRSTIETSFNSFPKAIHSTSTIPTAPPLTYTTTRPSTSNSNRRSVVDDSLIDLSGPTPKKLRMYPPKCTAGNTVKITLDEMDLRKAFMVGCLIGMRWRALRQ